MNIFGRKKMLDITKLAKMSNEEREQHVQIDVLEQVQGKRKGPLADVMKVLPNAEKEAFEYELKMRMNKNRGDD